ncbi:hypothetical protein Zm00014a_041798 [Zea mays]|uniref:Uncharacterized protein n=1 Tax=Zea mays TaxID=4577 RepID=A0A317YGK7_MAIZE|nr:hypothetical protein Zm00014a_041798 [Zea mays]
MAEQPPCSELLFFPSAAQLLHGETSLFLQPRHLPLLPRCQRCARATCSANCPSGVLRSEQHTGMPTGCSLFLCSPEHRRHSPLERNPVFCMEKKASRSTLVNVRSYAQIESPTFLQTPIGFVYGEPMHVALD